MRKLSSIAALAIALIVSASFAQEVEPSATTGTIRATVDYGPVPRAPSNSVELVLLRRQGEPEGELHQVRPDAAGVFVIEEISAGRWNLALHASDEKHHKFMTYGMAEVKPGETVEVALTVPASSATPAARRPSSPSSSSISPPAPAPSAPSTPSAAPPLAPEASPPPSSAASAARSSPSSEMSSLRSDSAGANGHVRTRRRRDRGLRHRHVPPTRSEAHGGEEMLSPCSKVSWGP